MHWAPALRFAPVGFSCSWLWLSRAVSHVTCEVWWGGLILWSGRTLLLIHFQPMPSYHARRSFLVGSQVHFTLLNFVSSLQFLSSRSSCYWCLPLVFVPSADFTTMLPLLLLFMTISGNIKQCCLRCGSVKKWLLHSSAFHLPCSASSIPSKPAPRPTSSLQYHMRCFTEAQVDAISYIPFVSEIHYLS